jgi:glycosyltransferase involved in cell wall biosynthesis
MNLEILALISFVLAAIPCGLFLSNLFVYRPLAKSKTKIATPLSVLIPARNEEQNIRATLAAVLANRGIEFEVVVLDDHSTDGTAKIISEIAARDPRVRLELAPPLPAGWCGKQHACHVLAQLAKNPLLVFIDADVRLAPDALARMAGLMEKNPVALASGVPRQELGTFSERLLIPLIHFILLGFLPMRLMRRTKSPAFSAGCGQLFIARRDAYQICGGHAQLRDSLHDGVKLPRVFRRAGFHTDLFDATDVATCRMYRTNTETWRGLGKNATEGLGAPGTILPMTALLLCGQIFPFALLVFAAPSSRPFKIAALAAMLALLPRLVAVWRFRQSWPGALLHPLGVIFLLGIQWFALSQKILGRPRQWKGRDYLPPKTDAKTLAARGSLALVAALIFSAANVRADSTPPVATTNLICASFALQDQFGTNHVVNFPRAQPLLLIVADRKGSEQIDAWIAALHSRYGARLEMTGVADVGGVPGWLQGLIRKKFQKKYPYPILLDWSGKIPAALHGQPDVANVFLFAPSGGVLARAQGECSADALSRMTQAADASVKTN